MPRLKRSFPFLLLLLQLSAAAHENIARRRNYQKETESYVVERNHKRRLSKRSSKRNSSSREYSSDDDFFSYSYKGSKSRLWHRTNNSHGSSRANKGTRVPDMLGTLLFPMKPLDRNPYSSNDIEPSESPTMIPTAASSAPSLSKSPSVKPSLMTSRYPTLTPSIPPSHKSKSPSEILSGAPTLFQSTSPSSISSGRPTSTLKPSTSPSVTASGAPTLFQSTSPSSISSGRPTSTIAPSASPSVVASVSPSSISSERPTLTTFPSVSPSVVTSEGPSPMPSVKPSNIDSGFPTLTVAPSASPSLIPSSLEISGGPSTNPSNLVSSIPTSFREPSTPPASLTSPSPTQVNGPTNLPSRVPSTLPSMEPTALPTIPLATASPSRARLEQVIPEFTLEYQLFDFSFPTQSDLVELEAVTRAYLRDYIIGTISNSTVLLEDFVTVYVTEESDPSVLVVKVTYESTAYYSLDSPIVPPVWDIEREVQNAFSGDNLDRYLEMVQALPTSNLFAGTIQIFEVSTSQLEAESNGSSTGTAFIIAGSAAAVALLSGYGWYAYKIRQQDRNATSKGIGAMIDGNESPSACSTNPDSFDKDGSDISDSNSSGNLSDQQLKEVWARHKSTECLVFGEESDCLGGETKSPRPPSDGKSLMHELRERLTNQNSSKITGKIRDMESGSLPPPPPPPSLRMQMMQELQERLKSRNDDVLTETQRVGKIQLKKGAEDFMPVKGGDPHSMLMQELRERISFRFDSSKISVCQLSESSDSNEAEDSDNDASDSSSTISSLYY